MMRQFHLSRWATAGAIVLAAAAAGWSAPSGPGRAVPGGIAASLRGGSCCVKYQQAACAGGSGCGTNNIWNLTSGSVYDAMGTSRTTDYCGSATDCRLQTTSINFCGGDL